MFRGGRADPALPPCITGTSGADWLGLPALDPLTRYATRADTSVALRVEVERVEAAPARTLGRIAPRILPPHILTDDFEETVRAVRDGLCDADIAAILADDAAVRFVCDEMGFSTARVREVWPERDLPDTKTYSIAWACILRVFLAHRAAEAARVPAVRTWLRLFVTQHVLLAGYLIYEVDEWSDAAARSDAWRYLSVVPAAGRHLYWIGQLPDMRYLILQHAALWHVQPEIGVPMLRDMVAVLVDKILVHKCGKRGLGEIVARLTKDHPYLALMLKDVLLCVLLGNYPRAGRPPPFGVQAAVAASVLGTATLSQADFAAWISANERLMVAVLRVFVYTTIDYTPLALFESVRRRYEDMTAAIYGVMERVHDVLREQWPVLQRWPPALVTRFPALAAEEDGWIRGHMRDVLHRACASVDQTEKEWGLGEFIFKKHKAPFWDLMAREIRMHFATVRRLLGDTPDKAARAFDTLQQAKRMLRRAGVPQDAWPKTVEAFVVHMPHERPPAHTVAMPEPSNRVLCTTQCFDEHPLLTEAEMRLIYVVAAHAAQCTTGPLRVAYLYVLGVPEETITKVALLYTAMEVRGAPDKAVTREIPLLADAGEGTPEEDLRSLCKIHMFMQTVTDIRAQHTVPLTVEIAHRQTAALRRRYGLDAAAPLPRTVGNLWFCDCGVVSSVVASNDDERSVHGLGARARRGVPMLNAFTGLNHCSRGRECHAAPLHRVSLIGVMRRVDGAYYCICVDCGAITTYEPARMTSRGPTCACEPLVARRRAQPVHAGALGTRAAGRLAARIIARTRPVSYTTTYGGACEFCGSGAAVDGVQVTDVRAGEIRRAGLCAIHLNMAGQYMMRNNLPPRYCVEWQTLCDALKVMDRRAGMNRAAGHHAASLGSVAREAERTGEVRERKEVV